MSEASKWIATYAQRPRLDVGQFVHCEISAEGDCVLRHSAQATTVVLTPAEAMSVAAWITRIFTESS